MRIPVFFTRSSETFARIFFTHEKPKSEEYASLPFLKDHILGGFPIGIICSAEQTVMVPIEKFDEVVSEFESHHCHFVSGTEEKQRLRNTLFEEEVPNKDAIGQDVAKIAELAGIAIPEDTKVLLVLKTNELLPYVGV